MLTISPRINTLLTTLIFHTAKSKRTTTPKPFNNPQLTPKGIITKQPHTYDYNLPQKLANRHLYWDRKVQNKISRARFNQNRLAKLQIHSIHDQQGKRIIRDPSTLVAELTSINVIRQSIGRTLTNIQQAIKNYPDRFLNGGSDSDVLNFALQQIHNRHVVSMNFYKFSLYLHFRTQVGLPPTQCLLLHFFRHIQGMKTNKNSENLTLQKLAYHLNYLFSIQYPGCHNLLKKQKKINQLFQQSEQKFITFEDVLPSIFSDEQIKLQKKDLKAKQLQYVTNVLQKIPGGIQLSQKIKNI